MNITKTVIEKISPPEKGYSIHWDQKLPGFGLRVTSTGVKSFIVQRRINGRDKRMTIGRFGPLTAEQARKEAKKLIGQIASGADPVAEKKRRQLETVTLEQAFAAYLERRKNLKPLTIKDIHRVLNEGLHDWKKKQLHDITPDQVIQKHAELGKHSQARSNLTMRYLRAVFNFAIAEYVDASGAPVLTNNPVQRISQTRAWFRIERRQTVIKSHQLKDWFTGINQLTSTVSKDYFLLVLLTGLRKTEALKLTWNDIDFKSKTLTVIDPKNRRDHTLPLSDFLFELLTRRRKRSVSDYVFSHSNGKRLTDPKSAQHAVIDYSGVRFTIHDLRRTFATIAESLDIPAYALKRLLNHSSAADVTAGYIVADVERLRKPMQKITDYILKAASTKDTAHIIEFKEATL